MAITFISLKPEPGYIVKDADLGTVGRVRNNTVQGYWIATPETASPLFDDETYFWSRKDAAQALVYFAQTGTVDPAIATYRLINGTYHKATSVQSGPVFTCALRFDPARLLELAARYDAAYDADIEGDIAPRVQQTGYLTKSDLEAIRHWKWPPSKGKPSKDDESFIRTVTQVALSTADERLRIEVLTLLDGVGWPVASVFLHFFHRDRYPILDRRALWSLGNDEPSYYDFPYWTSYTHCCRQLAADHHLTMRQLDRALWQFAGGQ